MQRVFLIFPLAFLLGGCQSPRPAAAEAEAKAPASILDVSNQDALHVWREALADEGVRFDERTLVALAGRLFQDIRDDYDYCRGHVIDLLFRRPEFTAQGLRAVEPLLLTEDCEMFGCYRTIAVYLSHPRMPADILSAYADQPWHAHHNEEWWKFERAARGVRHFAARRLLARRRKGLPPVPAPISPSAAFVQRLMETPLAIPEELEVDSPLADWSIEPKDYVFVHALAKDSPRLAGAPCDLARAQLLFKEPFQSAADWRSAVRPSGLTLTFPSAEARAAFLREAVPAYAMTGELPERGYPMRPDVRKMVGYIVTAEEVDGLPALRFDRRWPWRR